MALTAGVITEFSQSATTSTKKIDDTAGLTVAHEHAGCPRARRVVSRRRTPRERREKDRKPDTAHGAWAGSAAAAALYASTDLTSGTAVTTLPSEIVRRLGLVAGQELEWIEDGMGGFRVVPHQPETVAAIEAHETIMAEYDSVFRKLAQ